jgi:hypothetical protein
MITILISLLVSLSVAVFFRYLDRNNRSLDKVKNLQIKLRQILTNILISSNKE